MNSVAFGDTVWTPTYRPDVGTASEAYSVTHAHDSGYVIAGAAGGGFYVVSVKPDGDAAWTMQQGEAYVDNLNAISPTPDGNYGVAGYTQSIGAGSYDFYLGKIGTAPQYVCGDPDGNEIVNISDAVHLISYIFGGGPPPDPLLAGDCDCNKIVNISDAVYLITYSFVGGPEPCAACP